MKYRIKKTVAICAVSGLVLAGCSGGNSGGSGGQSSGGGGGNVPTTVGQAVTIDSTGLVPVLSSGSTTSVVYIHNNTDHVISNIQFSSQNNVLTQSNSFTAAAKNLLSKIGIFRFNATASDFLHSSASASCSSIAAKGSCALTFTTPYITPTQRGGSAIIRASYQDKGKTQHASQVINYSYISNTNAKGVVLAGGSDLASYGNSQGYTTVYAYVPANAGKHYTVKDIAFSNKNFQISSNDLTGVDLAPGVVQAIEVKSFTPNASLATKMNINSAQADSLQTIANNTELVALSPNSGPILVSSIVPLFDASKQKTATIFVSNIGSAEASVTASSSNPHISVTNPGTVAAGGDATVTATIDTAEAGNGLVTFSAGSTTAASGLAWYNQKPYFLIEANPQYDNKSHEGFASPADPETVTVTNVGGQPGTITAVDLSGVGSLLKATNVQDDCKGKTLKTQESCKVVFNAELVDPTAAQTGTVDTLADYLKLNVATAGGSIIGLYGYTFTSSTVPVIHGVATPDKLVVTNNNTQTKELKMVWTNYSAADTGNLTFTPPTLPAYFGTVNNGCTSPLAKNQSCTVTYTVGPVPTTTAVGSENYQFSVTDSTHSVTSPASASVEIISENIIDPPVDCPPGATDPSCGVVIPDPHGTSGTITPTSGTQADPFVFYGGTAGDKYIAIPVKNTGDAYTIVGVKTDSLSSQQWQLDLGTTYDPNNCLSGFTNNVGSYALDTNKSCDLVLVNQYGINGNAAIQSEQQTSAVSAANIVLPQLIVKSAASGSYTLQPTYGTSAATATNTVYVNNSQAVVSSTVTNDNTSAITFSYDTSNLLPAGYAAPNTPISLHLQANNNTDAGTSLFTLGNASGACVTDSNSTATCTLSDGHGTGAVVATLNPVVPDAVAQSGIPVYVGSWLADFAHASGQWAANSNPLAAATLKK